MNGKQKRYVGVHASLDKQVNIPHNSYLLYYSCDFLDSEPVRPHC